MKIKCMVVDDEEPARNGLRLLLDKRKDIFIQKTCKDGVEAIQAIPELKPDLVLLDIQMPGINGFEVLATLPEPLPHIIFITAHDNYAIDAFEVNAVDYLLKPFSDERFNQAMDKAALAITNAALRKSASFDKLVAAARNSLKEPTKILSRSGDKSRLIIKADGRINMVPLAEISYIEAYDYYIKVHVGNRYFLVRETMKNMEERLPSDQFVRIHKSYIVNSKMIENFGKLPDGNYQVTLITGQTLKVSRGYRTDLQQFFD